MTISRRTVFIYLICLLFIGILHHVDHILRYDHSGWPFRPEVTAFTFSLLVYPIIFSLFRSKNKIYRVCVSLLLALLIISAHIFLETPADEFHTWAQNSSTFASSLGHPNLLNVRSSILGAISTIIAMLLNVGIIFLPFIFWKADQTPPKAYKN